MSNGVFEHRGLARQESVVPWVLAHDAVLEVAKERARLDRREGTAETEPEWIDAARGRRVREVERMVSGRARGDRPTSAPRPELEKHVLRFEVSGETLAAFRDAMRRINESSGNKLDDDSALLLLARAALSAGAGDGDTDSLGRANYQVAVFECHHCKRAFQPAGADRVEIDAATLAAARCDAQRIDLTHGSAAAHVQAATPRGPHNRYLPPFGATCSCVTRRRVRSPAAETPSRSTCSRSAAIRGWHPPRR